MALISVRAQINDTDAKYCMVAFVPQTEVKEGDNVYVYFSDLSWAYTSAGVYTMFYYGHAKFPLKVTIGNFMPEETNNRVTQFEGEISDATGQTLETLWKSYQAINNEQ